MVPVRLLILLVVIAAGAGCMVSSASECRDDTDCAAGQRCMTGGGVFVQDGVCVEEGFEADTGELDSGPGELDSGPGDPDADPGELDSGPGDPDADSGELDSGPGDPDADAGDPDADAGPVDGGGDDVSPPCPTGQELCNGDCVDLSNNDDHCGGCHIVCEDEPNAEVYCSDSVCIRECDDGLEDCGESCLDLSNDVENCGQCGQACAAEEYCVGSQCQPCNPAGAPFGGGSGTTADPYAICTADHFLQIGATDLSAHYQLYGNISLAEVSSSPMVGDLDNPFEGHFDGDQYEIEGLSLSKDSENQIGLFARVAEGAVVENLVLLEVDVHGNNDVGGAVGRNYGTIKDVFVTGTVEGGNQSVGGVVGQNRGVMENTAFLGGEVSSVGHRLGGLVGRNLGSITDSHAVSTTKGATYVAGLVGHNELQGEIERSWVLTSVDGILLVGGFVGFNEGSIIDSYAVGEMEGRGGFVRSNAGIITNCYAAVDDIDSSNSAVFVHSASDDEYEFNACYYELDGTDDNCEGLSQQEFADPENFEGWDFVDVWEIGTAADGQTRPVLQWQ